MGKRRLSHDQGQWDEVFEGAKAEASSADEGGGRIASDFHESHRDNVRAIQGIFAERGRTEIGFRGHTGLGTTDVVIPARDQRDSGSGLE